MKIGFTGTQTGMTVDQTLVVERALQTFLKPGENWFHHGVCIGADEEAAAIARKLGYTLFAHPPINRSKMSSIVSDAEAAPKDYLDRNKDIVDACDLLLVTPAQALEVVRSGTWSTWRYAIRAGKPWLLVHPNGTFRAFDLDALLLQG